LTQPSDPDYPGIFVWTEAPFATSLVPLSARWAHHQAAPMINQRAMEVIVTRPLSPLSPALCPSAVQDKSCSSLSRLTATMTTNPKLEADIKSTLRYQSNNPKTQYSNNNYLNQN
jgi:hypothetical protein